MGQKDMTEKLLEDHNDVFADIINVLLFNGKEKVLPDSLKDTKVKSQYKAECDKLHEIERDVAKIWKNSNIQILFGVENQTAVDVFMPFRGISYDGASYRHQLVKNESGDIMPVITLVLYFGTKKRWNAPLNIKGLMDIPEELEPFVSDYKINVFEIAWLSDEQVKMFKSDFRIVADYFVQMRKNQHYVPEEKTVKHVDEVLKLMHALTGDKRYEVVFSEKEKERGVSMCDVLTKIDENARAEGRAEGRAEERKDCALKSIKMLRKCGQSDAFIVEQLREEYGYSLEDCEELMKS